MLGYFAIYGGRIADSFRAGATKSTPRRRWWYGRLPHEIAELNAR